jgi:hypothetical protein
LYDGVYMPVDEHTQLARIAHRQRHTPEETFPMDETDVAVWRSLFEEPDAEELADGAMRLPPAGSGGWAEWAVRRWPSFVKP